MCVAARPEEIAHCMVPFLQAARRDFFGHIEVLLMAMCLACESNNEKLLSQAGRLINGWV